jgi:hypothetical protein
VFAETVDSDCGSCTWFDSQYEKNCRGIGISPSGNGDTSISFSGTTDISTSTCCGASTCFGGAIWTKAFEATKDNSQVFFSYEADAGNDWYEAAIVLYEIPGVEAGHEVTQSQILESTPLVVQLVRGASVTAGNQVFDPEFPLDSSDPKKKYVLAFFMASYDRNNASALGASMSVFAFGRKPPDWDIDICDHGPIVISN